SPNWYLERAIAQFETSDENLHSQDEISKAYKYAAKPISFGSHLRDFPLTRCSVFKDQCLFLTLHRVSAATFIIYHSVYHFGKSFFEKKFFSFFLACSCFSIHRKGARDIMYHSGSLLVNLFS
ncbi:hypothetical protein, partial [Paenibacillus sp. sgz500992]|uniref:hypothetical protein n=1 Tax=Paenibacillus sp. sgz500992 TaxID=3242476 RepID=UPI0036D265CD